MIEKEAEYELRKPVSAIIVYKNNVMQSTLQFIVGVNDLSF